MNFKPWVAIFFFLMPEAVVAQSDEDLLIGQIMEYLAQQVSEDQDYSEITERLNFYRKHPLNINLADALQMRELAFISAVQINNLIAHREESGQFQDLLELQSIDGFDEETARWLMNFVIVRPPELFPQISLNELIHKSDHDLIIRFGRILENQAGYIASDSSNAVYSGSAYRIFTRYRFNYANKITASLNMEKDAGEPFFKPPGNGFDFYSANVSLKGYRFVKKLIVGDYALQFGQGLAMWSGLSFGKGAGLTTVAKQAVGLRPYSSVNESSFLRGLSATLGHKKNLVTPFISYKKLDASLSGNGDEINSLTVNGLHRTRTERGNKNRISQLVYGLHSEFESKALSAGLIVYRAQLGMPVAKGSSLYERYNFSGQTLTNIGFHYNYTFKNTYFFGEAAHSLPGGSAFLNGLMSSISSQVSIVLAYRNYARNYHSFFNQGLSESGEALNERGFYTGLMVKLSSKFELLSYFDFFRFPWLKFRVDAPSQGNELLAQLTYSLSKKFKISGRLKRQQKEENAMEVKTTEGLQHVEKQNYRVELTYKASNSFLLRNRVEVSTYEKGLAGKELGFLSYQDVIYNPLSSRFSGNIRFALFDTPGFNSRIYAYENDVLYGYSVPAYHGRGLRCYVNGRYKIHRGVDIWLRYALLSYSDAQTVGSGHDLISGNHRSDIKLQVRFQF